MAVGAMTMLLTNVGLNIYNNWANIRKNDKVRKLNEEYQRAIQDEQSDRVIELLKKGQEATLEIEHEHHKQRLSFIKEEFSQLLDQQVYAMALSDWPLKVSPLVMKHQTLGHFMCPDSNIENNPIPLHCILAPSNSDSFNRHVFPLLSNALDSYCNLNWLSKSDHPVLFYSGAWKDTSSSISNNGNVMSNLKTILGNLPVLIITPTFDKETHTFSILLATWGLGADVNQTDSTDSLYMPLQEIHPDELPNQDYDDRTEFDKNPELVRNCLEDLVPYFETIIGYIADSYFWAAYKSNPVLPMLLSNNVINTDGAKYLLTDAKHTYNKLLDMVLKEYSEFPIASDGLSELTDALEPVLGKSDTDNYRQIIRDLVPLVKVLKNTSSSIDINTVGRILESTDIIFLEQQSCNGYSCADYRLGEIYEFSLENTYNPELADSYYARAREKNDSFALLKYYIENNSSADLQSIVPRIESIDCIQKNLLLSLIYAQDTREKENICKAMDLLEEYEDSKDPRVKFYAARIVKEFYGKEQNELYRELMEAAAKQGLVYAQKELMNEYYDGNYLERDYKESLFFAKSAALQGDAEAMLHLGICMINGLGITKNREKGIELIQMAARRGNPDAIDIINRKKQ